MLLALSLIEATLRIKIMEEEGEEMDPIGEEVVANMAAVHTQNKVNELHLYSGSQSIYIVGFGFPTVGSPMLGDPVAHTLVLQILLFSIAKLLPFLSLFSSELPTPISHFILLFIA